MKSRLFSGKWLLMLSAFALAGSSCGETEKTESVTAEITAAQMQGRDAARRFIHQDRSSFSKLSERLDSVDSMKKRTVSGKHPQATAAFDSTFISTVRTIRPELAKEIEREKNKH